MIKTNENEKEDEDRSVQLNAVVTSEFNDLMIDALQIVRFAIDILKQDLPERWHSEVGVLWYDLHRIYVPELLRMKEKELSLDSPLAGHWGATRTIELAQRNYYRPNMTRDLRDYVTGLPEGRWIRVGMDFIIDLPETKNGNTAILTCIDAATKRGRFIACKLAGLTAENTANLIRKEVIRQHGTPKLFITDRGRQFKNKFWKQLGSTMGFEQTPTTSAHQQGNGLSERINQPLEAFLRAHVKFEQNDWDEYLDLFLNFLATNPNMPRPIGPFKIIKKITNQTYQLDLKNLVGKIYHVFHVDKLEIATTPQEGQYDYEREWLFNDEEVFKTLKDITNSRFRNGILEYEVSWSDGTKDWVARGELDDGIEINAFHNRNPDKPIPDTR
ncbi:hypothetical protein K3495_g2808 [Podosphaera aphanis]|nr:hypothetical protein K3495_g2808 [Podosphaera aphanis]